MNEQDIFNFLKDNLRIEADASLPNPSDNYGYDGGQITTRVYLFNPETGKEELISSCSGSLS